LSSASRAERFRTIDDHGLGGIAVPLSLFTKWTEVHNQRNRKVRMRYLGLGSAEGIKELPEWDFALAKSLSSPKIARADGDWVVGYKTFSCGSCQ
jgi:hypothetical protein